MNGAQPLCHEFITACRESFDSPLLIRDKAIPRRRRIARKIVALEATLRGRRRASGRSNARSPPCDSTGQAPVRPIRPHEVALGRLSRARDDDAGVRDALELYCAQFASTSAGPRFIGSITCTGHPRQLAANEHLKARCTRYVSRAERACVMTVTTAAPRARHFRIFDDTGRAGIRHSQTRACGWRGRCDRLKSSRPLAK